MDSRERVFRTLRFEHPDRAPHNIWAVPYIEMYRMAELDQVSATYPIDITVPTSATQKVVTAQSYFGEKAADNAIVLIWKIKAVERGSI